MTDEKPDRTEGPVAQHVRTMLGQIRALKARLRAQEQAQQAGSRDAVEVDREDDRAGEVDSTQRPS